MDSSSNFLSGRATPGEGLVTLHQSASADRYSPLKGPVSRSGVGHYGEGACVSKLVSISVHSWLKDLTCILGRMYTLPVNHSHDRGIWDSGAKLSVRHFVSVKAFLLSKGRRRRWGKIAESTFS